MKVQNITYELIIAADGIGDDIHWPLDCKTDRGAVRKAKSIINRNQRFWGRAASIVWFRKSDGCRDSLANWMSGK